MEERKERCIRCEKMRVGDLKHGFGNPRKITKKKAEELERSLEMFGDFGIFLIDENDNVIAGNQRSIIRQVPAAHREQHCGAACDRWHHHGHRPHQLVVQQQLHSGGDGGR